MSLRMAEGITHIKPDLIPCRMMRSILPSPSSRPFLSRQADLTQSLQAELERIDIKHHMMKLLCGGDLHFAPLLKPQRILDIGTGTGIWAMEMADQYPDAKIIGTDLSPVQPSWYETICQVRSWIAAKGQHVLRYPGFLTTYAL
jgi:hypothetical protein